MCVVGDATFCCCPCSCSSFPVLGCRIIFFLIPLHYYTQEVHSSWKSFSLWRRRPAAAFCCSECKLMYWILWNYFIDFLCVSTSMPAVLFITMNAKAEKMGNGEIAAQQILPYFVICVLICMLIKKIIFVSHVHYAAPKHWKVWWLRAYFKAGTVCSSTCDFPRGGCWIPGF